MVCTKMECNIKGGDWATEIKHAAIDCTSVNKYFSFHSLLNIQHPLSIVLHSLYKDKHSHSLETEYLHYFAKSHSIPIPNQLLHKTRTFRWQPTAVCVVPLYCCPDLHSIPVKWWVQNFDNWQVNYNYTWSATAGHHMPPCVVMHGSTCIKHLTGRRFTLKLTGRQSSHTSSGGGGEAELVRVRAGPPAATGHQRHIYTSN